jgi:AbrB family looped-hinge helix DNA binding protein
LSERQFLRSRLRVKGQVTIPAEIREILGAKEGDELVFMTDEDGRVIIERVQIVPPEQAWFWSKRWQRLENEAQQDFDTNKTHLFESFEEAQKFLDNAAGDENAENNAV